MHQIDGFNLKKLPLNGLNRNLPEGCLLTRVPMFKYCPVTSLTNNENIEKVKIPVYFLLRLSYHFSKLK